MQLLQYDKEDIYSFRKNYWRKTMINNKHVKLSQREIVVHASLFDVEWSVTPLTSLQLPVNICTSFSHQSVSRHLSISSHQSVLGNQSVSRYRSISRHQSVSRHQPICSDHSIYRRHSVYRHQSLDFDHSLDINFYSSINL